MGRLHVVFITSGLLASFQGVPPIPVILVVLKLLNVVPPTMLAKMCFAFLNAQLSNVVMMVVAEAVAPVMVIACVRL